MQQNLLNFTPRILGANATDRRSNLVSFDHIPKLFVQFYTKIINYTFIKEKLEVEHTVLQRQASKLMEVVRDMTNGVHDNSDSDSSDEMLYSSV